MALGFSSGRDSGISVGVVASVLRVGIPRLYSAEVVPNLFSRHSFGRTSRPLG